LRANTADDIRLRQTGTRFLPNRANGFARSLS
jgi:hypothetical protein